MPRRPAACFIAVALVLAGCAQAPQPRPRSSTVTEATVSVTTTPGASTTTLTGPSSPAATATAAVTADGDYDCYVRGVEHSGTGSVTVVFLTVFRGAEAEQAAKQADEQLPAGKDYYVRVDDPTERHLPLAAGVMAPDPPFSGVYRVSVRGGSVTAIHVEKLP